LLHIFVYGRNTEPWDPSSQARIQKDIEKADEWLRARAADNGSTMPPVFSHRFLTLPEEPFWTRLDVPDPDSSRDYRKAWLQAVLVRFEAKSYAELFNRVFDGTALDNRAVVFHTSAGDLSFAVFRPYSPEPTDLESTFSPAQATEWSNPYQAVSYTHKL